MIEKALAWGLRGIPWALCLTHIAIWIIANDMAYLWSYIGGVYWLTAGIILEIYIDRCCSALKSV